MKVKNDYDKGKRTKCNFKNEHFPNSAGMGWSRRAYYALGMHRDLLNFLWLIPQNIVACIYLLFNRGRIYTYAIIGEVNVFVIKRQKGSVSLGSSIFLGYEANSDLIRHEYGHSIQSQFLGWFYIPLVLLPSMTWALIYKLLLSRYTHYEWFFLESHASLLGRGKIVLFTDRINF